MFYQPELVVYLWMFPIFAMVVLPALWSCSRLFYRSMERMRLSDIRGFIDFSSSQEEIRTDERREQNRIQIEGPKAVVAQQTKCCKTQVANLSSNGLCLCNVPKRMFEDANGRLNVVLRTNERDYQLPVKPKWRKATERGFVIGTEITELPSGWNNFIHSLCRPATGDAV
jgi:hypothetical protein